MGFHDITDRDYLARVQNTDRDAIYSKLLNSKSELQEDYVKQFITDVIENINQLEAESTYYRETLIDNGIEIETL